ncbi:MAG: sigma-70 family RNA polymerase sigma factor [Clostridiales bacterium]|nr:sigma-70 family RNA polymerase sigma factor [Clostridiales bacterium]
MEDSQIVELYWRRDEAAVRETERKYGALCRGVARNILGVDEDAEECVNDALHQAWNAIPPQRPDRLGAWLGRVTRNLALNRWNKDRAQKRYAGVRLLLDELADCVPATGGVERELEGQELSAAIDRWLRTLSREDRALFLRRYWYGMELQALAAERGVSPNRLAQKMSRLRRSLKHTLEKEGFAL